MLQCLHAYASQFSKHFGFPSSAIKFHHHMRRQTSLKCSESDLLAYVCGINRLLSMHILNARIQSLISVL